MVQGNEKRLAIKRTYLNIESIITYNNVSEGLQKSAGKYAKRK